MAFEPGKGKVDVRVNYVGREIFDHYQRLVYHLETKANWLMGICSVLLVMMVTKYDSIAFNTFSSVGELVIIAGCVAAAINLMFLLVPRILPSNKYNNALREINAFEYKNVLQNFNSKSLANYLDTLTHNESELHKMHAHAIYQMVALRLPNYSRKILIAGWTLIISLSVGTLLIIIGALFY